jgi:hypothetical protein
MERPIQSAIENGRNFALAIWQREGSRGSFQISSVNSLLFGVLGTILLQDLQIEWRRYEKGCVITKWVTVDCCDIVGATSAASDDDKFSWDQEEEEEEGDSMKHPSPQELEQYLDQLPTPESQLDVPQTEKMNEETVVQIVPPPVEVTTSITKEVTKQKLEEEGWEQWE